LSRESIPRFNTRGEGPLGSTKCDSDDDDDDSDGDNDGVLVGISPSLSLLSVVALWQVVAYEQ
jgi:hypothetical protein